MRLGLVDGLSEADMLFCPIRLMHVPSEETTVLRSYIALPLNLHRHPLFLCPGECLLNPALGTWPDSPNNTANVVYAQA